MIKALSLYAIPLAASYGVVKILQRQDQIKERYQIQSPKKHKQK